MKISTGKGSISLVMLLAIWSVSAVTSLPGLAVSPILEDLTTIFPHASELEVQMLSSLPSLLIIPFVLLSGWLSERRESLGLLMAGLVLFFVSGAVCVFATTIRQLIVASCVMGVGAGVAVPYSTGLVVRYFTGDYRVRQLGISSAINNLSLVIATAAVVWLAERDDFALLSVDNASRFSAQPDYRTTALDDYICIAVRNGHRSAACGHSARCSVDVARNTLYGCGIWHFAARDIR